MNQPVLVHPTADQLSAFGLGHLGLTEAAEIESHLVQCESCRSAVEAVPDDTFVSALRGRGTKPDSRAGLLGGADLKPDEIPTVPHSPTLLVLPEALKGHHRYHVLEPLGSGGMGAVFKAEHRLMERPVALKVIHPSLLDKPAAVERFRREAKAAARLSHHNIVTAHDADQAGDTHFLVMEFVEGISLSRLVQEQGPLSVALACNYVRQAAEGLQHAFEHGMVHRDIKPANLMLTPKGRVKILDFGLARFIRESAPAEAADQPDPHQPHESYPPLTRLGVLMGTPDYMAPEQADDSRQADIRADIYSLGCTLYYLLAGHPPFPVADPGERIAAHATQTPRPITDIRKDVPPALAQVIEKMMAKSPAQRYQTPAEVVEALASFSVWRPPSRRRWPLLLGAAAVVLATVVGLAIYRIATDKGTLVIESEDEDVQVVIKQGGKQVKIIDPKSKQEIELNSGTYELELARGKPGLRLSTQQFVLERDGRRSVKAYFDATRAAGPWVAKKPLLQARHGHMAAEIDGCLYVVGGPGGIDSLEIYDPTAGKWTVGARLPLGVDVGDTARRHGAVAAIDGQLYLAGGWRDRIYLPKESRQTSGLPTDTLFIYNPGTDGWTLGPRIPIPNPDQLPGTPGSGDSVAGVIERRLYLLTGSDGWNETGDSGTYDKLFHVYDPDAVKWALLQSPPHVHAEGAGGVIDGKLYVVGGRAGSSVTDTVDVYDPVSRQWATRKPMPTPRRSHGCAVIAGKLYAVGGEDSKGAPLSVVEIYDPVKDEWTSGPPLPTPRAELAVVAVGNTIYAIGGYDGKNVLGSVDALTVGK